MYKCEEIAPEIYSLLSSELGSAKQLEGDKLKQFQDFFSFEEVYPIYYNHYNIFITHADEFLLEKCTEDKTKGLVVSIQIKMPEFHTYLCALTYNQHPFLSSLLS